MPHRLAACGASHPLQTPLVSMMVLISLFAGATIAQTPCTKTGTINGASYACNSQYLTTFPSTQWETGTFEVYLYSNQITAIPDGAFTGLTALVNLGLNGNRITAIPDGAFTGLTALAHLYLHANRITAIPEGAFTGLTALVYFILRGNPIVCRDDDLTKPIELSCSSCETGYGSLRTVILNKAKFLQCVMKPTQAPTQPPTVSCISGNMEVVTIKSNSTTIIPDMRNTAVVDLVPGDYIRGLTAEKTPTMCRVVKVGYFGEGTLYGNYTQHHFMFNASSGMIATHGVIGNSTFEDKYQLMTDCPLAIDETNQVFTPIDGDFCGEATHEMLWADYLMLYNAYYALVIKTGGFWLDKASFTDITEITEMSPAFCIEFFKCMKSDDTDDCVEFEKQAEHIVDNYLGPSEAKASHDAFPHMGDPTAKNGSVTAEAKRSNTKKSDFVKFIESIPDWVWGLFAAVVVVSIVITALVRRHYKKLVDEAKADMIEQFGGFVLKRGFGTVTDALKTFDTDGDGGLDKDEFEDLMNDLNVTPNSVVRKKLASAFDRNHDGRISFGEFKSVLAANKRASLILPHTGDRADVQSNPTNQTLQVTQI